MFELIMYNVIFLSIIVIDDVVISNKGRQYYLSEYV